MGPDDLMTLEEFAAEYRVPLATARYWRSTGKGGPRTFRQGRRVFVLRKDAIEWQRSCYEADAQSRNAS